MSAISLKSITGITSITTPAGVDNVFTVHTNDTTERFRVDQTGNLNIAGIVTVTKDLDVDGHTNLDNVSIAGVTTTVGDVTVGSGGENAALGVRFNSAYAQIKLPDGQTGANRKGNLSFGDNDDFRIVHDGHHNYITAGVGDIYISHGSANPVNIYNNRVDVNVDLTIKNTAPKLNLTDTNNNSDFRIKVESGQFDIDDTTSSNATRLRIYSNGEILIPNNVGFGVADPSEKVDVDGNIKVSGTIDANGDLDVDGHTNLDNVNIAGVTTSTGNIYADNYFGNSSLTLNANSNPSVNLTSNSTTGSSRINFGDPGSSSFGKIYYEHNGDYFKFDTAGSERLRITSTGNVGIARTDPDQKLNVNGNIEVNAYDNSNGGNGYYTSKGLIIGNAYDAGKTTTDDRNAIIWQERGLDLDFATNDTFRMKIKHDGNIGINNNNPTTKLQITDTSATILRTEATANDGDALIQALGKDSSGNDRMIQMRTDAGADQYRIISSDTSYNLALCTGNAPRLLIAGNSAATSIGGSNVFNAMLTVQGDISGEILRLKATENTNRLMISGTNSNGVEMNLYDEAGSQKGILGVSGSEFFIKAPHSSAPLQFYTHDGSSMASRLKISKHGQLLHGNPSEDQGWAVFFNAVGSGGDAGTAGTDGGGDKGVNIRTDMGPTHLDLDGIDNFTLKLANQAYSGAGVANPYGTVSKILFNTVTYNGWNSYGAIALQSVGVSAARGEMVFMLNNGTSSMNEKMRIKSTLIETANNTGMEIYGGDINHPNDSVFYVRKSSNADWAIKCDASHSNSSDYGMFSRVDNSASYAFGVNDTSTWRFRVSGGGQIYATNTSVASISDERLKENIVDANSQWDDIKALRFRNYKWRTDSGRADGKTYLGLIAQEVEPISPGLVDIDAQTKEDIENNVPDPEYKNVKYSIVWMKAVKALQEAQARIEQLEAKVSALEGS